MTTTSGYCKLALTSSVQAIVAVIGGSDLVPAFKFARREGARVFLCHMGHPIKRELLIHADRDIRLGTSRGVRAMPLSKPNVSAEAGRCP
jgi:uncharacterized LabA/DUF88 family protein